MLLLPAAEQRQAHDPRDYVAGQVQAQVDHRVRLAQDAVGLRVQVVDPLPYLSDPYLSDRAGGEAQTRHRQDQ